MKRLFAVAVLSLTFLLPNSAIAYDPGFGEYDPNRICYQAWCYMGDADNSVGSIVSPTHDEGGGGVGIGAFIYKRAIRFSEAVFLNGQYRVRITVITNRGGSLVTDEIYNGRATLKEAIVSIPFSRANADKLKKGRFMKAYLYRNDKLYISGTYPLYGFSKAYGHVH